MLSKQQANALEALVQHWASVPDQAWMACRGWRAEARFAAADSGAVLAKVRGE